MFERSRSSLVHHGSDGVNSKSLIILQSDRNPADESTDSITMASFFLFNSLEELELKQSHPVLDQV